MTLSKINQKLFFHQKIFTILEKIFETLEVINFKRFILDCRTTKKNLKDSFKPEGLK